MKPYSSRWKSELHKQLMINKRIGRVDGTLEEALIIMIERLIDWSYNHGKNEAYLEILDAETPKLLLRESLAKVKNTGGFIRDERLRKFVKNIIAENKERIHNLEDLLG